MKRLLTALVALPILLFTVWTETPYYFAGIATLAILLALHEFYNLAAKAGLRPQPLIGDAAALAITACFILKAPAAIVPVLAGLALAAVGSALLRPEEFERALASTGATMLGVVYTALLGGFLIGVRMLEGGAQTPKLAAKLLTLFFAMVMMTDTGAYYTGRTLGRHKLAPRISPGKTVEGSLGGFVTAILAGVVARGVFFPEIPLPHVVALGAVIGIVSQIGDLVESMLKRGSKVKDSGTIFPGHGGMLDRMDSLIFCAPLLFYYAAWFYE